MLAQADFDNALWTGVVLVVDQSAPGSTFKQDLSGTGEYAATAYGTGQTLATVLASGDADFSIIVTNEGINDETVEGDTPDQYKVDAQNWITTVQAAGKVALLLEENPIAPTSVACATCTDAFYDATAFVAAEHAAAGMYGVSVAPLYNAFIHVPQWNLTLLGPDGVHPNQDGYIYKEQQYLPTLLAAVKQMLGK